MMRDGEQGSGYLVGDGVRALFVGALTFREQCLVAGMRYEDLDSDDGVGQHGMVDDEAEEDGRGACAHVCSHNDRCEVCDMGGDGVLPCDYCNIVYHIGCLVPALDLADGEDVDFACPLCVAGRRAGLTDDDVGAAGTPDVGAEVALRLVRDEQVLSEHTAIEVHRRERGEAASTRATAPPRGEPVVTGEDLVPDEPHGRRRVGKPVEKVVEAVEVSKLRRKRRRSGDGGACGGSPAGRSSGQKSSGKHEWARTRDARVRNAKRMATGRAAAAAAAGALPAPAHASGWTDEQVANLGLAVAAVSGSALVGRTAIRRGGDGELHVATFARAARGGYSADFGEGVEQLALWDAMRCSEALPGDAGWVVDINA